MALSSWAAIRAFSCTHTHTHTFNIHDSSSCEQLCVALIFTSFLFSLLSTFLLRGTNFLLQTQTDIDSSRSHTIIELTCCDVVDKSFITCRAAQETNIYWSNESFCCFCSETIQERLPSPLVSISFPTLMLLSVCSFLQYLCSNFMLSSLVKDNQSAKSFIFIFECRWVCSDLLSLEDQFAHADQVLSDFGETLFAFVSDESRPVDQILIDLFQSFLVVLTELHLHTHTHTHTHRLQSKLKSFQETAHANVFLLYSACQLVEKLHSNQKHFLITHQKTSDSDACFFNSIKSWKQLWPLWNTFNQLWWGNKRHAHLLPHLGRKSCSLDHFHVEETLTYRSKRTRQ